MHELHCNKDPKESCSENEARAKGKEVEMFHGSHEEKQIRRNTLEMRVAASYDCSYSVK